jgi:NAD(P)-dependent dehydrogenase (short-subunit alcohol dehydrogenase family)
MDTYLITGIARGIGKALAQIALARGHKVIGSKRDGLCDFSHERLTVLAFDVTDDAAIERAANQVIGPIDVLIHNAGIYGPKNQKLTELSAPDLLNVLDVNTVGPFRVLKAFLPHLKQSAHGRVLMVSSEMGRFSRESKGGAGAYRASKAGVNKLVQTYAGELRPDNIAIIACHPGWVRTDMGGNGADIDAADSAKGLIDLAESLKIEGTGCFVDWTGERRDW